MNKVQLFIFSRSLALFLILCLTLPIDTVRPELVEGPVGRRDTLRTQAGLENDTRAKLEHELATPAQSPGSPLLLAAAGLEGAPKLGNKLRETMKVIGAQGILGNLQNRYVPLGKTEFLLVSGEEATAPKRIIPSSKITDASYTGAYILTQELEEAWGSGAGRRKYTVEVYAHPDIAKNGKMYAIIRPAGLETGVTRRQFLGAGAGAVAAGPAAVVELFDGLTVAGTSRIIPDDDIRSSNPGIGDRQTVKVTLGSANLPQASRIILQQGVKVSEIPASWQRFIDEENQMPEALEKASQFIKDHQVKPGDLVVVRDLAGEAAQAAEWNRLFRESGVLGVVPAVLQNLSFNPQVLKDRDDAVAALLAALSVAHQRFEGGLILGAQIQREGDRLHVYLYA